MPSGMPKMFGNGGCYEGACLAVLQQRHRSREPAETCGSSFDAWGPGWNSALQWLIIDGELRWISQGH
jgi:tRNA G26 N,N-dimethylase Trm1